MSLRAGPQEELAIRGTQGQLLEGLRSLCVFVSRGEGPGENKDSGPPARWTMHPRPAPEESVVYQCLCVCVCAHACVSKGSLEWDCGLGGLYIQVTAPGIQGQVERLSV